MADTYSGSNRLAIQTIGGNDSTWGDILNTSMGLIDTGLDGQLSKAVAGANITLTTANNAADEARNRMLVFTGTPGATRTITLPDVKKIYYVFNNTDSSLTFTAGAGTNVTLATLSRAILYTDAATNVAAHSHVSAFARTVLDDADAATARATLGLGSMALQAADAVAITGGTITGVSVSGAFSPSSMPDITGGIYSYQGSFTNLADGVATTMFSVPTVLEQQVWLIYGSTFDGSWYAIITSLTNSAGLNILAQGYTSSFAVVVSMVGTAIKVTQNHGTVADLRWAALRIGT